VLFPSHFVLGISSLRSSTCGHPLKIPSLEWKFWFPSLEELIPKGFPPCLASPAIGRFRRPKAEAATRRRRRGGGGFPFIRALPYDLIAFFFLSFFLCSSKERNKERAPKMITAAPPYKLAPSLKKSTGLFFNARPCPLRIALLALQNSLNFAPFSVCPRAVIIKSLDETKPPLPRLLRGISPRGGENSLDLT
jgi:hypothetical protein